MAAWSLCLLDRDKFSPTSLAFSHLRNNRAFHQEKPIKKKQNYF